jgi:hypothetical protein
MAASVSGSKTVTTNVSPVHTAANITSIFAIAPENMTVARLNFIAQCLRQKQGGEDPNTVIGTLFN